MRLACLIILAVSPCLLAATDIERKVEQLADQHHAAVGNSPDDAAAGASDESSSDCRWVTQVLTHQGINHTRRVRVCMERSWWSDWIARAKRAK